MASDRDPNIDHAPHWERVSEEYADARIRQHIDKFDNEHQRMGLENVDKALRDIDAPPGLRLHYLSTLALLGRKADGHARKRQDVTADLDSVDAGGARE